MKAVILAAGMGMRIDSSLPKPLLPLTRTKSILDYQIQNLSNVLTPDSITIVVGYKAAMIMELHPRMIYTYNHDYTKNGTAKSLLTALCKYENEDVLWMNGDIYCDEKSIELIAQEDSSCCLVDNKKCGEEEMKYTLTPDGYIHELSKQVPHPKGESLGINLIKANDLEIFKNELKAVAAKDFFEKALENLTIPGKLKLKPINKGNLFCHEIDFEEDLEVVKQYLLNKQQAP